jgi:hypothetical protein
MDKQTKIWLNGVGICVAHIVGHRVVIVMYEKTYVVFPSSAYLIRIGVEVFVFHLITLRHTPQSVGLLWTGDRPVAETST